MCSLRLFTLLCQLYDLRHRPSRFPWYKQLVTPGSIGCACSMFLCPACWPCLVRRRILHGTLPMRMRFLDHQRTGVHLDCTARIRSLATSMLFRMFLSHFHQFGFKAIFQVSAFGPLEEVLLNSMILRHLAQGQDHVLKTNEPNYRQWQQTSRNLKPLSLSPYLCFFMLCILSSLSFSIRPKPSASGHRYASAALASKWATSHNPPERWETKRSNENFGEKIAIESIDINWNQWNTMWTWIQQTMLDN